jgi:malonate decarboxylase alpha subunit
MRTWQHGREARDARIRAGAKLASGKVVEASNACAWRIAKFVFVS